MFGILDKDFEKLVRELLQEETGSSSAIILPFLDSDQLASERSHE